MSDEPEYNNTSTIDSQLILDPITEEDSSSCTYDDDILNDILVQNTDANNYVEHNDNIRVIDSNETNINIPQKHAGYNYDIVLTYKMIEDDDDQDTLFRLQFLQAFGITTDEYQPDVVSRELDILYSQFRENSKIQQILRSHPLYHRETRGDDSSSQDVNNSVADNILESEDGTAITMNTDNSEMIFCMMFSFQTFDLFHMCLQDIFYGRDIRNDIIEQIAVLHQNMF